MNKVTIHKKEFLKMSFGWKSKGFQNHNLSNTSLPHRKEKFWQWDIFHTVKQLFLLFYKILFTVVPCWFPTHNLVKHRNILWVVFWGLFNLRLFDDEHTNIQTRLEILKNNINIIPEHPNKVKENLLPCLWSVYFCDKCSPITCWFPLAKQNNLPGWPSLS